MRSQSRAAPASVAHVTLTWTLTLRLTGQRTSVLATGPLPGTGPPDFGGAASFSASAIGSPSDYTGCFQKTHVRTQENGRGLCEGRGNGLGPHGAFLSKVTGAVVDTHPAFALGGEGATLPLKGEVTSLCVPRLSISTVFRCFFLA